MGLISNIRRFFRNFLLNRAIKGSGTVRRVVEYAPGKQVLVLFDASDAHQQSAIDYLAQTFHADEIKAMYLGYVPKSAKYIQGIDNEEDIRYVHRKDLSWIMKPAHKDLQHFLAGPYDILLDLSHYRHFPIKCIAAWVYASFKVGVHHGESLAVYDLTLKVDDAYPADELARQAIHYLKILKTPAAHVK